MTNATFPKSERLCRKKHIDALFTGQGRSLSSFPLRAVFRPSGNATSTQVLISVSKRHFKHAVDRNRVKRQIREAWRLNKDLLLSAQADDGTQQTFHIAFIWLADELFPSETVHRKMRHLLHRIQESAAQ